MELVVSGDSQVHIQKGTTFNLSETPCKQCSLHSKIPDDKSSTEGRSDIDQRIVKSSELLINKLETLENQIQLKKKIDDDLKNLNQELQEQYKISSNLCELGVFANGRYGQVFLAIDPSTGDRIVKKKIYYSNFRMGHENRCYTEILSLAHILKQSNPNLLQVYKIEFEKKDCVLSMEYGHGTLLDLFLFLESERIIYYGLHDDLSNQIKSQIEILHQIKLCHRDIKPDNIILRDGLRAVLCDYGLSLVGLENKEQQLPIAGTFSYLPPEIETALKSGLGSVKHNPYESDRFALDKVLHLVKQKCEEWKYKFVEKEYFIKEFQTCMEDKIMKKLRPEKREILSQILQDISKRSHKENIEESNIISLNFTINNSDDCSLKIKEDV